MKLVQETSKRIKRTSMGKFSGGIELRRGRINILLHPLAQLNTSPEPRKVVKRLKLYCFRALEDEGIEVDRVEADALLNSILKDFLKKVLEIAEKTEVEPPTLYKSLYEEL